MKKIALQGAEFLPLDILEELALPIKGKIQEIFILFCLQPVYPTHTKQMKVQSLQHTKNIYWTVLTIQ